MHRHAVILAAHLVLSSAPGAVMAQQPSDATIVEAISRHMALHERHTGFSGTVLVARHGRPLFTRSYGLADREWEAPVDAQTRFRIGSITKPFTATAILMLAERGKLSIDDAVCRYVEPCPEIWRPVTLRHLLSHTSGIPNFTNLEALRGRELREQAPAELARAVAEHPLAFVPGTQWDYSNSGYLLLGLVIEKVSGRAYGDFLRDEIFAPAGMRATSRDLPGRIIARRASGYGLPGRTVENAPYVHMSSAFASGDLLSTADDLLRFEQALFGGKLLSAKSLEAMTTPVRNRYGLGIVADDVGGHRALQHGGAVMGFTSFLMRLPEDSLTVIVLSNFMDVNPEATAKELAAITLGMPVPEPRPQPPILVDPGPGVKGKVVFRLPGHPTARFIALAGTFNRWRSGHTGFVREGDEWVCRIDLPPGRYEYKFVVDGKWMRDPSNAVSTGTGEGEYDNSVLVVQ